MKNQLSLEKLSEQQEGTLHRRDFLIAGFKASLFLIACDAFGAPASGGKAAQLPDPAAGLDDSLHILADYLTRYTPPSGNFPANGSWKAAYDFVEVMHPKTTVNRVFGRLIVVRRPAGAGIAYEVDSSKMIHEFENILKSSMQCSSDQLPRLVEWKTKYETHVEAGKMVGRIQTFGDTKEPAILSTAAPAGLSERGLCSNGVVKITTPLGSRKLKTTRPVLPQWVLLDALRSAKADAPSPLAGIEFDLLHDLTSYRPHQRLKPVGMLQISLGGGSPQTFHGFVQTGFGTEPTHYWIDADGRPLLVTEGLISTVLTGIEAV